VALAIVLLLVYLVVAHLVFLFGQIIPIDFYQYWGAAAARRLSTEQLGSPYREARRYGAILAEAARRSSQPRFERVSEHATPPNFTATPFAYTLFAGLPTDYTHASRLYYALQIVLFLVAVGTLGLVYRYPPFPLLCLALLLVHGSSALNSDLRLGNVGCLQFVSLAVLLGLIHPLRAGSPSAALGGLALGGLTLLALAKPNVALAAILMALHLWVAHGFRFFARAALPAALAGGAAVIFSCLYFGSWTVWQEWYGAVAGPQPGTVGRLSSVGAHYVAGNYATPLLLGFWLRLGGWTATAFLAAALVASAAAVVGWSVWRDAGARAAPGRAALARVFGDPHVTMAIGVTLTLALPPLVWYHYYVIALVPSLWLLSVPSESPVPRLCGLIALILSAGLPTSLLLLLGWSSAGHVCAALSWVAVWCGTLLRLSERAPTATPSEAERHPARGPAAEGARHRRRRSRAAARP
jgi:hypothetical protein